MAACPAYPNKQRYGKRGEAKTALVRLRAYEVRREGNLSLRVFKCVVCGFYHLGHVTPGHTREGLRDFAERKRRAT